MRQFAIALILLSAVLFAWVLGSESDEIGPRDIAVLTATFALILSIQVSLLFLINTFLKSYLPRQRELVLIVATAILLGANAYFMAFYTLEQTTEFRIACAAVVGVVFLVLMMYSPARPVLILFAAVMLVASLAQYVYGRVTFVPKDVTADTISLPLKSDRNVYLIGTESLHSPLAYRELYGFDTPEFVKVLEAAGFRVLDGFSADRSTLKTFAAIFEFKRSLQHDDRGVRSAFLNDNSTFRSFRDAGYGIQVIYKNNYFSVHEGNVDHFYPPKESFEACGEMGPMFFYGLCREPVVNYINKHVLRATRLKPRESIEHFRKRADIAMESPRPWLTWIHVHFPSHTNGYYKYPDAEYIKNYSRRLKEEFSEVAENMRKTAVYIAEKDPNAVIVVFGDHGTHFYRGITKDQVFTEKPLVPPRNVLLDHNGTMLAVYPADFCVNRIKDGFSTKALIENIIACLNGNDSPTEAERKRARTVTFFNELHDVEDLLSSSVAQH